MLPRFEPVKLFNRLPGFQRAPSGREWTIFKRLPAILVAGTVVPGLVALALWASVPTERSAADERGLWLQIYQLVGLVVLHWTLVLTLAIGCIIVWLMKGPAYVADPYPPDDRKS